MIKVLTDQSASDSEPAIILTESNEHSKPCSAPNMKGDVICWQLASRRGSRRGERNGGRGEEREREQRVTGGRWQGPGKMRKRGGSGATEPLLQAPPPPASLQASPLHPHHQPGPRPKCRCDCPAPTQDLQRPHLLKDQEWT